MEELEDPFDLILHIAEGSGLLAVSVDRDRVPAQGLDDEVGDNPSVTRAHPWTVRIEDPDDASVDTMVGVVRHRHGFGEALGFVVDAAWTDGVHMPPVTFRLRVNLRVPVDLGGRGEQEASPFSLCQSECVVGPQAADLERLDRELEVVDRAGGRGEVQDAVDVLVEEERDGDVVFDQPKAVERLQMFGIFTGTRDEVVDADDVVTVFEEALGEVGAEKARSAGNDECNQTPT